MSNFLISTSGRLLRGTAVSIASLFLITGTAYAATTISANIVTNGALSVDGIVTLGNNSATAVVDSTNWDVTTLGAATFASVSGGGSGLTSLTAANISAGTAGISVTGNAGTVTDGVYTSGSYANPAWVTSLASSKLSGVLPALDGALLTTLTAANISAGTAGISVTGNAGTATALFANGANCGAGEAAAGVDASGAAEGCVAYMGSALTDGRIFVGNGSNVATGVTMSGDATISNTGAVTVASRPYAMFYGLTAGTGMTGTNYAGTIAVGAPVPFPQDGPAVGGIVSTTDTTFTIPVIGTYEITFNVHTTEPGQLQLTVDNGAGFVIAHECTGENMDPTAGGHPIVGNCIITTTATNAVIKVINPAGNSTALTITPSDGAETHANAQTLVIKKL